MVFLCFVAIMEWEYQCVYICGAVYLLYMAMMATVRSDVRAKVGCERGDWVTDFIVCCTMYVDCDDPNVSATILSPPLPLTLPAAVVAAAASSPLQREAMRMHRRCSRPKTHYKTRHRQTSPHALINDGCALGTPWRSRKCTRS